MAVVDLKQLPIVPIGLDNARIFDWGVNVMHVLETPETSAYCLGKVETFRCE